MDYLVILILSTIAFFICVFITRGIFRIDKIVSTLSEQNRIGNEQLELTRQVKELALIETKKTVTKVQYRNSVGEIKITTLEDWINTHSKEPANKIENIG